MSTTLPPPPPVRDAPPDPEALIKEARRRTRRRRALYAVAGLFVAGAAITGYGSFHGGGRAPANHARGTEASAPWVPPARPASGVANGPLALIDAVSPDRIVVVDQGGRLLRTLPVCREPRCGGIQSAAWSPNGSMLAYGTATGPGGASAPRDGLHLLDLKANRDRLLDHSWSNWQDLAWSQDGRRLAYVESASVYVMQMSNPKQITPVRTNATSPTWSPSGRLIAFDGCAGGRSSGIDVGLPDGSHVRHLTRVGCSPAWSPDGSRIAYKVQCGIRVITPTGKDLTAPSAWRCRHIGVAGPPAWSPDSRKIAIAGNDGVYLMNRDGAGLTRIWNEPALRPSWRPVLSR